jgi:hypothetical protein
MSYLFQVKKREGDGGDGERASGREIQKKQGKDGNPSSFWPDTPLFSLSAISKIMAGLLKKAL